MRKLNQTFGNVAYGAFSDSNNYATETNNFGETAFGILNKSTIDPDNFTSRDVVKSSKATLFSIGNGTEEERKNVIEIKGNGDVYINGVAGYTGTDTDDAGNIAEEFQGVHDSLDSIHMQKDDDSDLVYTLIVDGEERGTINIPKDQFLEDVSYDDDTKELVFIFVTSDENNKEVRINIGNLVDIYSAGNGLSLIEGQFAIKLDPSTESYITVGADGLKVSGLDSKFNTLTQKDTEQDGRIQTAEGDIDALQSDLSALKGDGEGSIGNQIQAAVDALKGGVSESYDTLKKIEDNIVSTNDSYLKWENPYTRYNIDTTKEGLYFGLGNEYVTMFMKKSSNSIEIDPAKIWIENRSDSNLIDQYISINCWPSPSIGLQDSTEDTDLNINSSSIQFSTVRYIGTPLCILDKTGITLADKSNTDLLHAGGGTTTLKTINNTSLLGSGNIEVPTTESIQDITGSNTYTGANYISKETNLTDAVIQLDEEIKATNDNLALEHANAEATYSKLDTTPFAGAKTYDGEHPTLTDWLPTQRSFIGTFNTDRAAGKWLNVISCRHRNGNNDGHAYGMYITNMLTDVGPLRWNQQINGEWQGEKVILDSSNYTDYVPTIDEITTQVTAKLVDGAPETLDTLNELAAALGDDPNFATTVTNQIAQKADKTTATTSANGLMSSADKSKLDSIDTSTLATKTELEGYLPLSGGTLTGYLKMRELDGSELKHETFSLDLVQGYLDSKESYMKFNVHPGNHSTNRTFIEIGNLIDSNTAADSSDVLGIYSDFFQARFNPISKSFAVCHRPNTSKDVMWSDITLAPRDDGDACVRITSYLGDSKDSSNFNQAIYKSTGITFRNKTASDLLHAAGGTTTLKTINGQSLLGSGDITTPTPTVNAASGTKTIWTGTQSEYDGVTSKDANTLYFITEG